MDFYVSHCFCGSFLLDFLKKNSKHEQTQMYKVVYTLDDIVWVWALEPPPHTKQVDAAGFLVKVNQQETSHFS